MNDKIGDLRKVKKRKKTSKPRPSSVVIEATSRSVSTKKKSKKPSVKKLVAEYRTQDLQEVQNFYINEASKLLHKFPKNIEELYQCAQALLGVNIPYTNCFDHTDAPLMWFADNFFGWSPVTVTVAPRGGSKTFYGSANHWIKCTILPGYEGGHAAANESQAKVASKYLKNMAKNPLFVPLLLRGEVGTYTAKWRNGSFWTISRSSMAGISGQHPHMLTADEIEFWTVDGLKQALGTAVDYSRGGIYIPSVLSFFSTRQRVTGGTFWMMEEATKRNFRQYVWSIFECMSPCKTCAALDEHPHGSDQSRNEVCPLWEDCKGVAGRKCTGWIPREKVIEMKSREDYVSWQTQYMCAKPATTGLVYAAFEHSYYPEGNYLDPDIGLGEYDPTLPYVIWADPSESGTAAAFFVQEKKLDGHKRLVIFDEVVEDNCKSTIDFKIAIMDKIMMMGYDMPEFIVSDASRVEAHTDFERGTKTGIGVNYSIKSRPPSKASKNGGTGQEIELTIPHVRRKINANGLRTLLVNPVNCPRLCRAFKVYSYDTNSQGEIVKKNPNKKGSDEMDGIRYGVLRYVQDNPEGSKSSLVTIMSG